MLTRLNYSSNPISNETIFPKLIKTTTHHTIHSIHYNNSCLRINKVHFSIEKSVNNNAINFLKSNKLSQLKLPPHRLLQIHIIRSFGNKTKSKKLGSQPLESRTFNPGVPEFFRNRGFNAHPGKIAACGLFGGFLGAFCGVGGGIVMIPLLRNITNMTAHQIAGTRYKYIHTIFLQ